MDKWIQIDRYRQTDIDRQINYSNIIDRQIDRDTKAEHGLDLRDFKKQLNRANVVEPLSLSGGSS